MKHYLHLLIEALILTIMEFPYCRKKVSPSLVALNIDWFTNCGWVDQLLAFKQIDHYSTVKI